MQRLRCLRLTHRRWRPPAQNWQDTGELHHGAAPPAQGPALPTRRQPQDSRTASSAHVSGLDDEHWAAHRYSRRWLSSKTTRHHHHPRRRGVSEAPRRLTPAPPSRFLAIAEAGVRAHRGSPPTPLSSFPCEAGLASARSGANDGVGDLSVALRTARAALDYTEGEWSRRHRRGRGRGGGVWMEAVGAGERRGTLADLTGVGATATAAAEDVDVDDDEEAAAPLCSRPTASEEAEAVAMATIMEWVLLAAAAAAVHVPILNAPADSAPPLDLAGAQERCRCTLRHTLLSLSAEDPTTPPVFSTSPVLRRSLARRAALGYLDFLATRAHHTPCEAEWRALCARLTVSGRTERWVGGAVGSGTGTTAAKEGRAVALLPLLPSAFLPVDAAQGAIEEGGDVGSGADESVAERELHMLASTLTLAQAQAIVRWAVARTSPSGAAAHLSSQDVQYVLSRLVKSAAGRDEEEGGEYMAAQAHEEPPPPPPAVAELVALWERSRARERADRRLARACGLDRTASTTIAVRGMSVAAGGARGGGHDGTDAPGMAATADFSERILRGEWRAVLRVIVEHARATTANEGGEGFSSPPPASADTDAADLLLRQAMGSDVVGTIEAIAGSPLAALRRLFAHPSPRGVTAAPLFTSPRHALRYDMPSTYAGGPVTAAEVELIVHGRWAAACDLPGLTPPTTPTTTTTTITADGGSHGGEDRGASTEAEVAYVRGRLAALHARECRAGRRAAAPPAAIVELRRRLWLLAQLPPHLPKTLVRFHGAAGGPYLRRHAARELLPWLLVALAGFAAEAALAEKTAACTAVLRAVSSAVRPTLFDPHEDYAALHDAVSDLLLHMGTAAVEVAVERHRHRAGDEAAALAVWARKAEGALYEWAKEVLRPPPPPPPPPQQQQSQSPPVPERTAAVGTWTNYWASIYLEVLVQLSPSLAHDAAAAADVADALRPTTREGRVVLGPEAAAAITTALVLRLLPGAGNERDEHDGVQALTRAVTATGDGTLWFAALAEHGPGVPAIFKAMYDPSYMTEITGSSAPATLRDPREVRPAALLLGRALRLRSRYPTSATESLFTTTRTATGVTLSRLSGVDKLSYRVFAVDLARAVALFAARARAGHDRGGPRLVATGGTPEVGQWADHIQPPPPPTRLPYGLCVVDKPALVNTTLHARYDSLLPFLARTLPWGAPAPPPVTDVGSGAALDARLASATAPVRHQHGLLNRIDVGTSGLVLVARDPAGLHRGRAATLVHHRVHKRYRALVQYCPSSDSAAPPRALSWPAGAGAAVVGARVWFLPTRGSISSAVVADGTDAGAMQLAAPVAPAAAALLMDRRPAQTHYRVLEYFPAERVSYVEVTLRSGRKHQIRQHMAQLQHPLLGDDRYHPLLHERRGRERERRRGSVLELLTRPALHACGLDLVGEEAAERVVVHCDIPADMQRALQWLRQRQAARERERERESSNREAAPSGPSRVHRRTR